MASVSFDSGGLTPDGQVHTVEATWLFDVSGVHILAPSHLRSATPGSAVTARVTTKHLKYDSHATDRECKFVAIILDRYGSLAKESDDFLDLIASEAGSPGIRPSHGCSPADFRCNISQLWQFGYAHMTRHTASGAY